MPTEAFSVTQHQAFDTKAIPSVVIPGSRLLLSHREWSGEYRLRCHAETSKPPSPPVNTGSRYTTALSSRGATAISESADFVAKTGHGYTTFITLTFNAEARERVKSRIEKITPIKLFASRTIREQSKTILHQYDWPTEKTREWGKIDDAWGYYCPLRYKKVPNELYDFIGPRVKVTYEWESSIQREVSRLMNAMKKMKKRGWIPKYTRQRKEKTADNCEFTPIKFNTEKQRLHGSLPIDSEFRYCWVAEAPISEHGEENIHVHVLLEWVVPPSIFTCWAKRIEGIWGQGFAHLEKMKDPTKAGGYIAKAAKYLSKSARGDDQGEIRGNRYAISAAARAPGWEYSAQWSWGVMGELMKIAKRDIELIKQHYSGVKGQEEKEKARLNIEKTQENKDEVKEKKAMISVNKGIPIVFGYYSTIFRGAEMLDKFLEWSMKAGWKMKASPISGYCNALNESIRSRRRRIEAKRFSGISLQQVEQQWALQQEREESLIT